MANIVNRIQLILEEEKFPMFEYEIVEKLDAQEKISIEGQFQLSRVLNSEKYGFGKIGQRYFNLGENYYTSFIPRFLYIQNSLKSTIGSQSNSFIPFLFF